MSTRSYNHLSVGVASPAIRFRSGALKRIVSVLLGCAILGFAVENLIADIHDGDADRRGEISLSSPDSTNAGQNNSSSTDDSSSGHAAHVCHCIHAHGGLPGVTESRLADAEHGAQLRGVSDRMPHSISTEPRVRPPLA